MNTEQSDGRESVKARRPPCRAMAILMPQQDFQLSSTVQGTQKFDGLIQMLFVGIQVWRLDFHHRCECSVSDPRG